MKDSLTKETVIRTNIGTIIVVIGLIVAGTGAWTTLMIKSSQNTNLINQNTVRINEIDSSNDLNRQILSGIQGDIKEINAKLGN